MKIDQLKGFQLGADDYITKPIDEEVLVAKVQAILNRKNPSTLDTTLHFEKVSLFSDKNLLKIGEQEVQLTSRENDLMKMLLQRPGQLVSRNDLLQKLWGSTDEFSRKSMDVFISRLRKYLKGNSNVYIGNVHGKGFILENEIEQLRVELIKLALEGFQNLQGLNL